MLDDHDDVHDISLLLIIEASQGVVEHDLAAGDLYGTEVVSQIPGTVINFCLDYPPDLGCDLAVNQ